MVAGFAAPPRGELARTVPSTRLNAGKGRMTSASGFGATTRDARDEPVATETQDPRVPLSRPSDFGMGFNRTAVHPVREMSLLAQATFKGSHADLRARSQRKVDAAFVALDTWLTAVSL